MRKFILIILFFAIFAILVGFYFSKSPSPSPVVVAPTPTPLPRVLWGGILPGIPFGDLVSKMGPPQKTNATEGQVSMFYPGVDKNWDTEVVIRNDVISFIREHIFPPQNTSLSSRLQQFDVSPVRLYGKISESSMFLFVFPDRGVAFIASEKNDTVHEAWYFQPAPLGQLLLLPEFRGYSTDPRLVPGGR